MATQNLLRLPKVEAATGYKRSTIYRLIKEGSFPAPISIGARASAWIEDEINAWIESRIRASRTPDKPTNSRALREVNHA